MMQYFYKCLPNCRSGVETEYLGRVISNEPTVPASDDGWVKKKTLVE
jgi:hypothetical protein